jgi:hypothetical protein
MIENPELRAKILDWQKRYNIQDGDPAIALLELVEFIGHTSSGAAPAPRASEPVERPVVATAQISSDSLAEAMKTGFLPVIERMSYQAQELHQKLEQIDFEKFVKQIETYHEGIDYCTKKLDVVKKETDALIVRADKAAAQIRPITFGAVITLMAAAAIVGAVVVKLWF